MGKTPQNSVPLLLPLVGEWWGYDIDCQKAREKA